MTQSSAAITARGIRKSFGEHTVLADVDLEVDRGTIFALGRAAERRRVAEGMSR
jgi:ABC-type transporter Mla maintaining outer membrane lipid asymmetry ATPase subunit MlaF